MCIRDRSKAVKGFAAVKNTAKSAVNTVGSTISAVGQSMPISSAMQGIKSVGSALTSMVGGSMYLQMSEQFGGQGISVRINGKYRKVFTNKTGKFYYKQNNKKVYIKQDGAGLASIFKGLAKKAMPMAKNFIKTQGKAMAEQVGTEMLNSALAPAAVAPAVVAPPRPQVVYAPPPAALAPQVYAPQKETQQQKQTTQQK